MQRNIQTTGKKTPQIIPSETALRPCAAHTIHAGRDLPSSLNSMGTCGIDAKPINVALGEFEAAVVGASNGLSAPKRKPAPLTGARCCGWRGWGSLLLGSDYRCTHSYVALVIVWTRQMAW